MSTYVRRAFAPLSNRNFRLFFLGQLVSMTGTNAQLLAQVWLAVELGASPSALGVLTMLQFAPMLALCSWGGLLADRFDRRRLFMAVQGVGLVGACALATLSAAGVMTLPILYVLSFGLGTLTAVEFPLRQAMVHDLVGPVALPGAVSLTMAQVNASRLLGPALGGIVIATAGVSACFVLNVGTYIVVIAALALVTTTHLHAPPSVPRRRGQLREAVTYVRGQTPLSSALVFLVLFFGIGWSWEVLLPLLATESFDGGSATLSTLTAALGAGSMLGGVVMAGRVHTSDRALLGAGAAYAIVMLLLAAAPGPVVGAVLVMVIGCCGLVVSAASSVRIQLAATSEMRGRVMAMWSVAIQGTRPICSLATGVVADVLTPRWVLVAQGAGIVLVVLPLWAWSGRGSLRWRAHVGALCRKADAPLAPDRR
ncbi:MAG: MFS transporter [Microbacteriaceae bacterium]